MMKRRAIADSQLLYLLLLPLSTVPKRNNEMAVSAMTQTCTSIASDHTAHTGHSYNDIDELSKAKQGPRLHVERLKQGLCQEMNLGMSIRGLHASKVEDQCRLQACCFTADRMSRRARKASHSRFCIVSAI